jgi:hypothetical protein
MAVPKSLISEVVSLCHSIYAAHPGRKHTLDIVGLRNWWPGMGRDVIVTLTDVMHVNEGTESVSLEHPWARSQNLPDRSKSAI